MADSVSSDSHSSQEEDQPTGPFTDTHCHIHEADYPEAEAAFERAVQAGVQRLVCVGTDEKTSAEAVEFAKSHDNIWASVGLHPHDAKSGMKAVRDLEDMIQHSPLRVVGGQDRHVASLSAGPVARGTSHPERGQDGVPSSRATRAGESIVAIGECGLDYFYNNSPREKQIDMLHAQLELAEKYDLAVIFHVREAFDDFWPIWREHSIKRAVLHSFTDSVANLEKAVQDDLFIGVNGIATFARDKQSMYAAIPLENLVLETDSPFLTPTPYRGKVNEPAYLTLVAKHIADLQSINLQELSAATERNATKLFFKTNN